MLSVLACLERCPVEVELGSIEFVDETLRFHTYHKMETLTFENVSGENKKSGLLQHFHSNDIILTENECANDLGTSRDYYNGETIWVIFESTDFHFNYFISIQVAQAFPDTLLYDQFSMYGRIGRYVIKDMTLNIPRTLNAEYPRGDHIYIKDTVLHGQPFENVYQTADQNNAFLFSPDIGLVAMIENGGLWVVSR